MSRSSIARELDNPIDGKIFVFSGRLANFSRQEAAALVRLRGGLTRRDVTRRTAYLVLGEGRRPLRRSRKLEIASRLEGAGQSIRVLSEDQFLDMLGLESTRPLRRSYYSGADVERLYGLNRTKLRALERMRLTSPILRTRAERYYTFADLHVFRRVKDGLARGGSLASMARRILQDRVGQLSFDFEKVGPAPIVALPLTAALEERLSWTADDWYLLGCEHDEDAEQAEPALAAYRQALAIDPYHVGSLINLGNLLYEDDRIQDARRLYERALASDPDNSSASFNLGNVYDDLGCYEDAIRYFKRAVRLRPDNADAHFNLGLVYDRLGDVSRVRAHMSSYLKLDADGDMAEVAREYLHLTRDESS